MDDEADEGRYWCFPLSIGEDDEVRSKSNLIEQIFQGLAGVRNSAPFGKRPVHIDISPLPIGEDNDLRT